MKSLALVRAPRGRWKAAGRSLLADHPELAGARLLVDFTDWLQVEHRWFSPLGPVARRDAVHAAAARLGRPVECLVGGDPWQVTWYFTCQVVGVNVCCAAIVCWCHDGAVADALAPANAPDYDDAIAAATGAALRELIPADLHPRLAEAEVIADAQIALKGR